MGTQGGSGACTPPPQQDSWALQLEQGGVLVVRGAAESQSAIGSHWARCKRRGARRRTPRHTARLQHLCPFQQKQTGEGGKGDDITKTPTTHQRRTRPAGGKTYRLDKNNRTCDTPGSGCGKRAQLWAGRRPFQPSVQVAGRAAAPQPAAVWCMCQLHRALKPAAPVSAAAAAC